MTYILSFVIVAIAVVLAIFTGIWGGLAWIVVAGVALAIVVLARARDAKITRTKPEPTVLPRAGAAPGTANERVGQG
jgi:D-alanyl-lipoteichoic acid acyltransferase DltB (MBOAT superfamily)